nr:uncharacterized protein LOC113739246 [Coffea arabica]
MIISFKLTISKPKLLQIRRGNIKGRKKGQKKKPQGRVAGKQCCRNPPPPSPFESSLKHSYATIIVHHSAASSIRLPILLWLFEEAGALSRRIHYGKFVVEVKFKIPLEELLLTFHAKVIVHTMVALPTVRICVKLQRLKVILYFVLWCGYVNLYPYACFIFCSYFLFIYRLTFYST